MVRIFALLLSLVGSLTILGSAASAQPTNSFYNVTLVSQPAATRTIVRGMVFACNGGTCSGAEGNSRPGVICASLARELGPITSFRAGDAALDADALAKCNAKAGTTKLARR